MRNAKKTLSLVMIAIFTTFIVLSGIPAGAVTAAAAKAQVTKATAAVVKVEKTVKVSNFNPTTAVTQFNAANKEVAKVKSLGKTYTKTYTALAKRNATVRTRILARQAAVRAQAAAAAKLFTDADKAVTAAENAVDGDKVDLVTDEAALANAQGAVTAALEMVVKLNPNTANYKGLMARIDAANGMIVKAMDEIAAIKAAEDAKAAEEAAAKAAAEAAAKAAAEAETAVKAVEDAVAAGQLTQAVELAKVAVEKIAAVKDAEKAAAFNARLLALAPAKVASVTAVDGTITVNFDKKPITTLAAADFTVTKAIGTAAAANVTPTAVTVVSDTAVTLTVPVIAATTADQSVVYTVAYGTNAAVTAAAYTVAKLPALTVTSVTAVNANEIKVVYNRAFYTATAEVAANYKVYVAGSQLSTGYEVTAGDDGMSVVIRLTTPIANAQSYKVSVSSVMDAYYQTMPSYTGTTQLFTDTAAPVLASASYTGSTLKLTFNKPMVATGMVVKVDGIVYGGTTASTSVGTYTASTTVANLAAGTHTVVVYNAQDTLGHIASILTASFTITVDTTVPTVTEVAGYSTKKFTVDFSEVVTNLSGGVLSSANFVITKGNYTFASTAYTVTQDADDTTVYYVTMADSDTNNPLYTGTETTSVLNVTVKSFKDTANYVGTAYTTAVTLTADTTAPYIVANTLNTVSGNVISVKFSETLASVSASKITVKNSDSILIPVVSAAVNGVNGKFVDITLGATTSTVYTVSFAANAVLDPSDNGNVAATASINNVAGTNEFVPTVSVSTGNVITLSYGRAMTATAADLANYTLDGAAMPAGTSIGFVANNQTVQITMPTSFFATTAASMFGISTNVVSVDGAYYVADPDTGKAFTALHVFTDNVKPVLASAKFTLASASDVSTSTITLTYNETITATDATDFKVTVNGVSVTVNTATASGKTVVLTLASPVNVTQTTTVTTNATSSTNTAIDTVDAYGNTSATGITVTVAQ